jgi:uncharacterized protein (TIGR03437 family)
MRFVLLLAALAPAFAQNCSTLVAYSPPINISADPNYGNVLVNTPPGCLWTFSSDSSWLGFTAGPAYGLGSGNDQFTWSAALNNLPVNRQGVISVVPLVGTASTVKITVTQQAAPAVTLSLQPASASIGATGGAGSFQAQTNWYWSAASAAGWITVPAGAGGSASGTVAYTVSANPCSTQRTGSVVVQPAPMVAPSQSFQLTEDGSPANLTVAPQSVAIPSAAYDGQFAVTTDGSCSWSATSYVSWVHISLGSGSGAGPVAYHVDANAAGSARSGVIQTGPAAFTVTQQAAPAAAVQVAAVVNAASYSAAQTAVAPGEIVALYGTNLGPAKGVPMQVNADGKTIATTLGGTTVLFDNVPAALTYVSATQVNAVVPYGVAGKASTQVQAQYQGALSPAVTLPVQAAAPGLFSLDGTGLGAAAVLNQDYKVNSAVAPAARGSVVMIYCTGGGVTTPASADATLTPVPTDPSQLAWLTQSANVTVTIGGLPATVWYAGGAPGAIAGLTQINAQIPAGVTPGAAVPVVVQLGAWKSQTGVTIAVD